MLFIESEVGNRRLELDENGETFSIDNRRSRFDDAVSGEILLEIARQHPNPIGKEAIRAILSEMHRDPGGVAKAIMNLRRTLADEGFEGILTTIRNRGYALSEGWIVYNPLQYDAQISEYLEELNGLRADAINEVNRAKYCHSASDIQYVIVEGGRANQHFMRFQAAAWGLLLALSADSRSNAQYLHQLKDQLFQFASYITFWRVSTRHSEDEWKDEFRREVDAKYGLIKTLIQQLISHS